MQILLKINLMIKKLISNILRKKGYNFVNINKVKVSSFKDRYDSMYILLFALQKKNYKIIQVGANNGVTGDPVNHFVLDFNKSISYLGFEPQEEPYNELTNNYNNYNNFYLIKQCIGEEKKSNFYCVNQKYQNLCIKNGWKVTTGVNSLIKENLLKRLNENNLNAKEYIESYEVQVLPLKKSIEMNYPNILRNFRNIDLLQVDAEGYDDQVIYNSSIEFFKPKYINFEYKNLSKTNLENLLKYLKQNSYECLRWRYNDYLAVLKENV